ncbi:MAG: peptide chain release factor aRF-1 [Promethearchaeota archaeon]
MAEEEDNNFKKYLLKKSLNILKKKKGYHTELITLMIPPNRKISDVTNYLKNEISESSNIKSKLTRKNVIDSINALLQKLKNIKEIPKNGLIMFSGAIPQGNTPGTEKIELYIVEPIEPITTFKYHCSSEFYLEPLEEMLKEKKTYGIVVIDGKELAIGWVRGRHIEIIKTSTSGVASKHHAGGQSQRRFERLHEEQMNYFISRAAETINEVFLPMYEEGNLEGIFIGGAGHTKYKLRDRNLLDYRLKDKIIEFYDIGVGGAEGIREVILKAADKIKNVRYLKEKKLMQKFLFNLSQDNGLIAYGEKEVRYALNQGAVDTLLISESLEMSRINILCPQCKYTESFTIKNERLKEVEETVSNQICPKCNSSTIRIEEVKDLIEDLGEIGESMGTKLELISEETEEGEALKNTFGGIAAILRYRIN